MRGFRGQSRSHSLLNLPISNSDSEIPPPSTIAFYPTEKMSSELFKAARDGDEAKVRRLLEDNDAAVHEKDKDGLTPLLIAVKRGHKEVARLVLDHDADTINASDEDGNTALHLATKARHKEIVRLLLRQHPDITDECNDSGRTALHLAVKMGDLVITRLLVKSGTDVDIMDDSGNTAAMVAERLGHRQIVDLLKDSWDGDGETVWSDPVSDRKSFAGKPRPASTAAGGSGGRGPSSSAPRGEATPPPTTHSPEGDSAQLWSSVTGKEFATGSQQFAISSSSGYLAGAFGRQVRLMEVKTGTVVSTLAIAGGNSNSVHSISALAFSRDGQLLLIGIYYNNNTGYVELWDVKVRARVMELYLSTGSATSVALCNDGKYLAVAHNNYVRIWKRDTGIEIKSQDARPGRVVTFSPDGSLLAAAGANQHLYFWEPSTGVPVSTLVSPATITALAFSPKGDILATASDARLWLRTPRWGAATNFLEISPGSIGFHPDGQLLACPMRDGGIGLWDVTRQSFLSIIKDSKPSVVKQVAFSSDGEILASLTKDDKIMFWWPAPDPAPRTEAGATFGRR